MQFKKFYFIIALVVCFNSFQGNAQFLGGDSYIFSNDHLGDTCDFIAFTPFAGGGADGFSNDRLGDTCNFIAFTPFAGGSADGFSNDRLGDTCNFIAFTPFGGGSADGFSNDRFGDTCNFTAFTPFAGGSADGFSSFTYLIVDIATCDPIHPLPIELLYFDAVKEIDSVRTEWTTMSERNNDYFTVERSLDGYNWSDIGEVSGAGNSSSQLDYVWHDTKPENGVLYYRLRQTDYDGKFTHSEIRTVVFEGEMSPFTLYPNPTEGTINLLVNGAELENVKMMIYASSGQLVFQHNDFSGTSYSFDLSNYERGVYILKVHSADGIKIFKVVKR